MRRKNKSIFNYLIAVIIVLVALSSILMLFADYSAYQKTKISKDKTKISGEVVSSGILNLTVNRPPIDSTPPKITITRLSPTSASSITINGNYTENYYIGSIKVEVNSSYIIFSTIDVSSKTWSATTNLTEGWNKFNVLANDLAGNFANVSSSSQGVSILFDTTKPTINLTSPQNMSSVANNSLLTFKISDLSLANAFYTINNGTTRSFNSIYELKAGTSDWVDGINYVIVNATDSTNNVERKNFTFTYSNSYSVVLNNSIITTKASIANINGTINDIKDSSSLQSLIDNSPVKISVVEYNKTLNDLGVITNLSNAVNAIQALLNDISDANSSSNDSATKTDLINAKLDQIGIIKNTTVSTVNINLFNSNLSVEVKNETKSNVTSTLLAAVAGLSEADKNSFREQSDVLQNKTTIINKVQTLTQAFINGRTQNITLFEKNISVNETQSGEFYVNEFIDKNITGGNDLNANIDVTNKIVQPMAVVVADPQVRWSFSNTAGAVVQYAINKNVPSEKVAESKTIVTTIPTAGAGASSGSGGSSGSGSSGEGGGGGGSGTLIQKSANELASVQKRWDAASAGEVLIYIIKNADIAVNKIKIKVINTLNEVYIKVSSLKENPTNTVPSKNIYQFLEIVKSNIKNSDISSATINFNVPKNFLKQNKIAENDIVLYEFDAQWNALPTKLILSDPEYVYYESETSGFSIFAIGTNELPLADFATSQDVIKIALKQNETKTVLFKIKNTGDIKLDIDIGTDLQQYINIKNKKITLEAGQEREISFNLSVENEPNVYTGKIFLTSPYLKKEIKLIIEVQPAVSLFNAKVIVKYKQVQKCSLIEANIALINTGEPKNATLFYSIKNLNNSEIVSNKEIIYIKEPMLINRELKLPCTINADKYLFYVSLASNDKKIFATDIFEVVIVSFMETLARFQFKLWWLISFVFAVLAIITYYNITSHKIIIKKPKPMKLPNLDIALSLKIVKLEEVEKYMNSIRKELNILKALYNSGNISFEEHLRRKEKLERQLRELIKVKNKLKKLTSS